jgi:glutamyl/glutaminyl-tRNA synthetase
VIRAEEHLPNTARQLMLYEALGETAPRFAHVPLILNRDRSKMSKRSGEAAVSVADWRRAGYVPEALLSYLALLGFHPGDDREILSRDELIQAFTLDRVGKAGAIFDADKLRWVNAHYLHHADGATLRAWAAEFLPEEARGLPEASLEALLAGVRGNLTTLADLGSELRNFLVDPPEFEPGAAAELATPQARQLCAELGAAIRDLAPWSRDTFKSAVQSVGKRLSIKGRELFHPIRVALSGRTHGPELPVLAELLGRERCMARLEAAARGIAS